MKVLFGIICLMGVLTAHANVRTYQGGYIDLAWGDACESPYGDIMTDLTQIQSEKVLIKLYKGNGGYNSVINLISPGEMITTESKVYDCYRLARCANALSSSEISVSAQCLSGNNLRVRFIPNI